MISKENFIKFTEVVESSLTRPRCDLVEWSATIASFLLDIDKNSFEGFKIDYWDLLEKGYINYKIFTVDKVTEITIDNWNDFYDFYTKQ